MSGICIPKSVIEKVRTAIKSGDINLEKLYHMSNDEAHTLFENYVGKENATALNAEYEKAKLTATKKAAADYVTASDKLGFQKAATAGEFAKKLLNDNEKKALAVKGIDAKLRQVDALRTKYAAKLAVATDPEAKANAQAKINKLNDQEARLNVRKEDTQNPVNDRLVNKINSMKEVLSDADYQDLIATKMGHELSPAQGNYIAQQATQLREMSQDTTNPENQTFGVSSEYYNKKAALESYINNLNPNTAINVLGRFIDATRLSLITGLSTPIKVMANYTNHPAGMVLRRIASLSLTGDNASLAKELNTKDAEFTKKTGTSLSQLRDKNDIGSILGSHKGDTSFGGSESFEKPPVAAGKGITGVASKIITPVEAALHKIAITIEHQYSFNYVWRNTFYDVLNIRASDYARAEGLKGADVKGRAAEIISDAARLDPQTEAGKALRAEGQAVASKITNTNDTVVSRAAVGMKNAINNMVPGAKLGDLIEPMAKIPANVIANGIGNTAVGVPWAMKDIIAGNLKMTADATLEEKYQGLAQYKKGVEHLTSIIGSLAVAGIITANLSAKDFRYDKYGNSFMKVGNLWVNTEYVARLAPNIAGMMSIKMQPKENPVLSYLVGHSVGEGSLGSLIKTPGIDALSQTTSAALGQKPVQTAETAAESRIPSIALQLFKPEDLQRKTFRVLFGATGVETDAEYKADKEAASKKAAATRQANAVAKAKLR